MLLFNTADSNENHGVTPHLHFFWRTLCGFQTIIPPPKKKKTLSAASQHKPPEFNIFRQNAVPHHAIDLQIHIGISLRYNPQVEKHEPNPYRPTLGQKWPHSRRKCR